MRKPVTVRRWVIVVGILAAVAMVLFSVSSLVNTVRLYDKTHRDESEIDRLQDDLTCRSRATIAKDLAQIRADAAVLGGLVVLVDRDQDGVAENPAYQPTLDSIVRSSFDLSLAHTAREADLERLESLPC